MVGEGTKKGKIIYFSWNCMKLSFRDQREFIEFFYKVIIGFKKHNFKVSAKLNI